MDEEDLEALAFMMEMSAVLKLLVLNAVERDITKEQFIYACKIMWETCPRGK